VTPSFSASNHAPVGVAGQDPALADLDPVGSFTCGKRASSRTVWVIDCSWVDDSVGLGISLIIG
jgi:hypothetical protein